MPDLIRFYIKNVLIGFGIAGAFVTGLLYWDVLRLWHLISTSPQGWVAGAMLFGANATLFAGVQFAVAVLLMADDDAGSNDPQGGDRIGDLVPARAPLPPATHLNRSRRNG